MSARRPLLFPLGAAVLGFALGITTGSHHTEHRAAAADGAAPAAGAVFGGSGSNEDLIAAACTALLERHDFRQLARLGALLDRFDSAQMRELLDKLDSRPDPDREVLELRLLACLTKRDPEAATAWMQPRLAVCLKQKSFGGGFANFETDLIREWAENAPELAVEFARQHPGTGAGEIALHNAIFSWPDKDFAHRFEILRDFPDGRARQKILVSFLSSWAQKDRAAAFAAAMTQPESPERKDALTEILAQWAGHELTVALDKAQALKLNDPALMTIMMKEAAKSDPAAAAHWLDAQTTAYAPQVTGTLVQLWAQKDPTVALAWALAHGVSLVESIDMQALNPSRNLFAGHFAELSYKSPLSAALSSQPAATLAWLSALPPGADRDCYLEQAVMHLPDASAAEPLVAQLPPEAAARASAHIAEQLANKEPEQARQWAENLTGPSRMAAWTAIGRMRGGPLPLPPGPDRDAMLCGAATGCATYQPEQALDRVLEIGDLALRRRTLDDVFWELNRGPTDLGHGASMSAPSETVKNAARAWLARAQIPEDWKQAWR